MVGIIKQDRTIIGENRLGFIERDVVLPEILPGLCGIPFEADGVHVARYVQRTYGASAGGDGSELSRAAQEPNDN